MTDEEQVGENVRRLAARLGMTVEEATAGVPDFVEAIKRYGITIGPELWTTAQAAEHCGVAPRTYTSYVVRQGAPAAVSRQPGARGQDLYDAAAVRHWQAHRPGRGARTDRRT